MRRAIDVARGAGRKVAFTLSDAFIIDRHGDDFRALIAEGLFDILFANEVEICALAEEKDFEAAVAKVAPQVPLLVVTRSEQGAIAVTGGARTAVPARSEEHTSELQSLMRISYAVFCLKKKQQKTSQKHTPAHSE